MATQPSGRILVIDDNQYNLHMFERQLAHRGHTVVVATSGQHGLELARQQRFDLILLDLMMPEMDGYSVLALLQQDVRLRQIPVIVVSAADDIDDVVRCIEAGAVDFLPKPITSVLLYAKIDAILERKRLRDQEQAYLAALRYELELGRRMQADFLPAALPHIAGWDVVAAFVPAREVAGDFYDVFNLSDQQFVCLIGDICDKGVGAALFMALTRSLLRAFIEQAALMRIDPLRAVIMTNDYIVRHHHASRTFSTIFCAILDSATGTMRYINAGHPAPLLCRVSGETVWLEPTGPAIGWIPNASFASATIELAEGDQVFVYTDGIIEARSPDGALFGEERLRQVVESAADNCRLLDTIQQQVLEYTGHQQPADDLTMLMIRRLAGAA